MNIFPLLSWGVSIIYHIFSMGCGPYFFAGILFSAFALLHMSSLYSDWMEYLILQNDFNVFDCFQNRPQVWPPALALSLSYRRWVLHVLNEISFDASNVNFLRDYSTISWRCSFLGTYSYKRACTSNGCVWMLYIYIDIFFVSAPACGWSSIQVNVNIYFIWHRRLSSLLFCEFIRSVGSFFSYIVFTPLSKSKTIVFHP